MSQTPINFYFVTLHPRIIESYCEVGIFKRAIDEAKVKVHIVYLREYAVDKHGSIDDKPYGGGPGMIMRPEPLADAVQAIKDNDPDAKVLLLDPKGEVWTQKNAEEFNAKPYSCIFVCGRFEGIDQRFIDLYVDKQISVGQYIVSGGELPALTVADSILRMQTLDEPSLHDTFSSQFDNKKEYPQYTRPEIFKGQKVPKILLSGNHQKIEEWRGTKKVT